MGVNSGGTRGSNKTFVGVYSNELVFEYSKEEDLVRKLESLDFNTEPAGYHKGIQVRQKAKGKNKGDDVFYYVLDDVGGTLTNMLVKENDWGDTLEIEFTDVDEKFVVSLGDVFSRNVKDMVRRLDNLDLNHEVVFGVWSMTPEETGAGHRSGVKMYQDEEKIEYAIGYDDMPEPVKKKKGRKEEWDYSEQEAFLFDELEEFIKDNFKPEPPKKEKPAKEEPKKEAPKKSTGTSRRAKAKEETEEKAPAKRGRAKKDAKDPF